MPNNSISFRQNFGHWRIVWGNGHVYNFSWVWVSNSSCYNRTALVNRQRICLSWWPRWSGSWGWIITQIPISAGSVQLKPRRHTSLLTPSLCAPSPNVSRRFDPVVLSKPAGARAFGSCGIPYTHGLHTALILTLLQYMWSHTGLCCATVQIAIIGRFCFYFRPQSDLFSLSICQR